MTVTTKLDLQPAVITLLDSLDAARSPPIRPDRRRVRTRAAILNAAEKLFATRSIDSVSIEEITEAAGVAKGSFYNHFADKTAIAEEIFRLIRAHAGDLIDNATTGAWPTAEKLVRGGLITLRFGLEHRESASALYRLSPGLLADETPLNVRAREILQHGMADGSFRTMPLDAALLLLIGVEIVMLQRAIETPPNRDALAFVVPLMVALLSGLGVALSEATIAVERAAEDVLGDLATP